MQLVKDLLRRALVAPLMLIGWLIVLVIRAMWGRELFWHEGVLVVRLDPASWPLNAEKKGGGWYRGWAGTSFGHGIMLTHGAPADVLAHELVHSEQHDANALGGLMLAIPLFFVAWWAALLTWILAPLVMYLGALLVAWLRGESAYRGNHLEEAAYHAVDEKR